VGAGKKTYRKNQPTRSGVGEERIKRTICTYAKIVPKYRGSVGVP